ncbi:MAG: type II toxin-antitoxin system ParD family antitoxin [Pseudoxanthomonas sp.]
MPNIHLTGPMQDYVQGQISSGAYANLSEVVRAGVRLLMERDGARQFYALKADLERASADAQSGAFEVFDPKAFEPEAFTSK